ncbi:MAG: ROK family protein [candidate division WOR-3 bacterium]
MSVIGIDIGGTNIKAGLVEDKKIIKRISLPTMAERGFATTINQIRGAIKGLITGSKTDITAIGIGIAGIIDSKNGTVRYSPNLKDWHNINLADILNNEFKLKTRIVNDVNAILLGEWKFGAGRGYSNIFLFTLGTGVGGAAVCEGRMLFGANDFAGEFGHTTINFNGPRCTCGNRGCLERYVGTKGIIALARRKLKKEKSRLGRYQRLTPKIIADEAKKRDRVAIEVFTEIGELIGVGLGNIINLLDPEVIIISGGVARAGRVLFEAIEKSAALRTLGTQYRRYRILPAQLGDDAGILGSAYFATIRH